MANNDNRGQFPLSLVDIGTITTVLIPLLYTAGWSFAYHYFQHFHLGMNGLIIQKETLFLYSFWVIKDQLLLTIVSVLFLIFLYIGIRMCFRKAINHESKKIQHLFQYIGLVLVPIAVLCIFSLFYHLGDRTADHVYKYQAQSDFSSYPRVKVWLNEKDAKEAGAIADEWSSGCYRLLLRDKENLYIFFSGGYKNPTEVIPQGKVRSVRILPLYQSSKNCKT
jgi:hypothetical protein